MFFSFLGIWVRSSITSAIYRKSLRVSPQGKAESTTGEVVNLMSVDTQRIVDMMPYINMLWRLQDISTPKITIFLDTQSKQGTSNSFIHQGDWRRLRLVIH